MKLALLLPELRLRVLNNQVKAAEYELPLAHVEIEDRLQHAIDRLVVAGVIEEKIYHRQIFKVGNRNFTPLFTVT